MAAVSEFMPPYDADNATSAKHDVQNDRAATEEEEEEEDRNCSTQSAA